MTTTLTAASDLPNLTELERELLALVQRFQDCGNEDTGSGERRNFWEDWDDCCIAADTLIDQLAATR